MNVCNSTELKNIESETNKSKKKKIHQSTIIVGDFNIFLSAINITYRQKTSKHNRVFEH